MIPPSQRDYGHQDSSQLVPGSLTVFRHFTVDTKRGVIQPMSVQPLAWVNSQRAATALSKNGDGMFGPYPVKYAPLVAGCNRSYFPANVSVDHKSPDPGCTCGFYASYDPATDFYPGVQWGDAWDRESCMLPSGLETGFAIVRAAVEMSGTVVMGHRGVRAEKMKIKAIALDTSKWLSPLDSARSARKEWWWFSPFDTGPDFPEPQRVSGLTDDEVEDLSEEGRAEMERTRSAVARVAREYGVRFFGDDTAALERAYPKADVAALGVDTSPPPRSDGLNVLSQAQVQLYASSTQQHGKSFVHDILKQVDKVIEAETARRKAQRILAQASGFKADRVILDEAVSMTLPDAKFPGVTHTVRVKPATPFERALAKKKERPAPPGTGIDRRRGRLR